ncbi:MAG: PAS domain-containing protein [Desulfobacterales bacterium]|jgi:transcriptional regulator with PAS, ATPase and Fis domain
MNIEPRNNRQRMPLTLTDGFFKKLVDHMQIGVVVSDANGYLVYMNNTYARFLNLDPAEQIGKHATDVVANSRLHNVAKTGKAEINYPHQFKDIGYLVHRIPIKENGRVVAVLGLVLFDSASTDSKLANNLSFLESKLNLYQNGLRPYVRPVIRLTASSARAVSSTN